MFLCYVVLVHKEQQCVHRFNESSVTCVHFCVDRYGLPFVNWFSQLFWKEYSCIINIGMRRPILSHRLNFTVSYDFSDNIIKKFVCVWNWLVMDIACTITKYYKKMFNLLKVCSSFVSEWSSCLSLFAKMECQVLQCYTSEFRYLNNKRCW